MVPADESPDVKEFWKISDRPLAEQFFRKWYFWGTHLHLPPMIDAAKSLMSHLEGMLNYFVGRRTNGILEAINRTIQSLKRTARGYRNTDNFVTINDMRCGKLQFNLPI